MNVDWTPWILTGIATGIVPLLIALLSYRQAKEANRQTTALESRKADREAFETAQKIYRDAIAVLEERIVMSQKIYHDALSTLEVQLDAARSRITELESRLTSLENGTL
jgi:hypothetical protein